MESEALTLWTVFDGWQGHQISLVRAIEPLTRESLSYKPAPELRTVGEITNHIAGGRVDWLTRIGEVDPKQVRQVESWDDGDGVNEDATRLIRRLTISWQLVEDKLKQWTVADLSKAYPLPYGGKTYAVSRQWILWRIMAHDLHHGGEIALMLGEQGIAIPELGQEGGHITVPPLMK